MGDCTKIFRLTKILLGKKIFISLRRFITDIVSVIHMQTYVCFLYKNFMEKIKRFY